jgi:hypothetical protein
MVLAAAQEGINFCKGSYHATDGYGTSRLARLFSEALLRRKHFVYEAVPIFDARMADDVSALCIEL